MRNETRPVGMGNHKILPIAALLAAFAGLFAAVVLSLGHVMDLPVPCGRSRGCLAVALHPASKVLGVPIAFIGVGVYLLVLFLLRRGAEARCSRVGLMALTGVGTAASAALLYYSQTVIRATCPWCFASGVAMTVLFLLSLRSVRGTPVLRPPPPGVFWTMAFLTAAALGVQAALMEKAAAAPPVAASVLQELGQDELVDPLKTLGPADAPVTVVIFGDLRCPGCAAAHASLMAYRQAHPSAVRLAFRHLPLWEIRGHELSRAAAALSEMAAGKGKFWPFLEAVYSSPQKMSAAEYLALLTRLDPECGDAEARLNNHGDPAVTRVLRDEALAARLGISQTPVFIIMVAGRPPVSASQRTLPRLLNSGLVQSKLAGLPQGPL